MPSRPAALHKPHCFAVPLPPGFLPVAHMHNPCEQRISKIDVKANVLRSELGWHFMLRCQMVTPNVLRCELSLHFMLRYQIVTPNVLRCEQR